jgi:hypothetical protein
VAVVALVAAERAWQSSERKKALDRLSSKPGFPLPMLLALREARFAAQEAQGEADALERRLDSRSRARARRARKQQQQNNNDGNHDANTTTGLSKSRLSNPFLSPMPADASLDGVASRALAAAGAPSLAEAERLVRAVLTTHLNFQGLDLSALQSLAQSGAPTPAQLALGQTADKNLQRRVRQALESALAAAPGVDPAVLPYVLGMLGHNQHLQARLLRRLAEEEMEENDAATGGNSILNAATDLSASQLDAASARRFRQAEQSLLQSLTLYRHHFAFSPRPFAPQVLHALGSLYADGGDSRQAEAVLIHGLNMLAMAEKDLVKWNAKRAAEAELIAQDVAAAASEARNIDPEASEQTLLQQQLQSELADPLTMSRLARCSSELAQSLAAVQRQRGRFDLAAQWDAEALQQWDRHNAHESEALKAMTQKQLQDKLILMTDNNGAAAIITATALSNNGDSSGVVQAALLSHYRSSLPQALHMLSALSADHFAAAEYEAPGSPVHAQQEQASYDAALQALQTLEYIVALDKKARAVAASDMRDVNGTKGAAAAVDQTEAIAAVAAQDPASAAASLTAPPHARFVSDAFVSSLNNCLHLMELDASAATAALAAAQAASLAAEGPPHKRRTRGQHASELNRRLARDVPLPLQPYDQAVRQLREEAAAAFHNLAKLLQARAREEQQQQQQENSAAAAVLADVQRAKQISKHLHKAAQRALT